MSVSVSWCWVGGVTCKGLYGEWFYLFLKWCLDFSVSCLYDYEVMWLVFYYFYLTWLLQHNKINNWSYMCVYGSLVCSIGLFCIKISESALGIGSPIGRPSCLVFTLFCHNVKQFCDMSFVNIYKWPLFLITLYYFVWKMHFLLSRLVFIYDYCYVWFFLTNWLRFCLCPLSLVLF